VKERDNTTRVSDKQKCDNTMCNNDAEYRLVLVNNERKSYCDIHTRQAINAHIVASWVTVR